MPGGEASRQDAPIMSRRLVYNHALTTLQQQSPSLARPSDMIDQSLGTTNCLTQSCCSRKQRSKQSKLEQLQTYDHPEDHPYGLENESARLKCTSAEANLSAMCARLGIHL